MKKLIALLALTFVTQAFPYDLTHRFGIGASGGFPIPIFDNAFNDAADAKWSASIHGKYHFDPKVALELDVSKYAFKKTSMYFENINLLASVRTAGSDNFSPVVGIGAGATRIKNFSPDDLRFLFLIRVGVEYALAPSLNLGALVDASEVDMPSGYANVLNPQLALTWYFGAENEKKEPSQVAVQEKVAPTESDVVSVANAATLRDEMKPDLTIEFDTEKAVIKTHYIDQIKKVADRLNEDTTLSGLIEGHADITGPKEFNDKLSEMRAMAVKKRLIEFGVDERRLRTEGFGYDRPIADNKTVEGRQRNRRASVIILVVKSNLSDSE